MSVWQYNREVLSERQFKSGVFDIDYAAFEEKPMTTNNGRKLTAAEKERQMREEEKEEKVSRTARLKAAMNQSSGDGVRKYNSRFGSFSGAGVVDPKDIASNGVGSNATVKVTEDQKDELRQQGVKVDHLEEGDEIALSNLNWTKPEEA